MRLVAALMACYHPVRAFRAVVPNEAGKLPVAFKPNAYFVQPVDLPCGKCVGCRLERTRQWAVRAMHEASLHEDNCFVTLTYDPAHLPSPPSLVPRHLQLFWKRLRRRLAPRRISFLACGEYGELRDRPHYHALIFGYWPSDCVRVGRPKGHDIFSSQLLADCWKMGFVSVGTLTFESAAYVARYSLKKVDNHARSDARWFAADSSGQVVALSHYERLDYDTGELYFLLPEFLRCSLRPAIGKRWFEQFAPEVLQSDSVVTRGREMKPPRYYDKLVSEVSPLLDAEIKAQRRLAADERYDEGSTARLRSREKVAQARISQFKRELE